MKKIKHIAKKAIDNEVVNRARAPKNKFWKRIRFAGVCMAVIGGTLASFPVSLPASVVAWGTYIATIGGTMAMMAQGTKK